MPSPNTQTQTKIEHRAMRPKQAAASYNVGRTTLYGWMKSGKLASARIGGVRLISVDALEALLAGGA